MRPANRGYMQTLRCEASLAELWRALVLPEALRLWHADEAWIDARPGGSYRYRSRLFGTRQAHVDLIEPGRRLRLVYDPNPDWPPAGDSVIVEDFLLDTRGTGTSRTRAPGAAPSLTSARMVVPSGGASRTAAASVVMEW